MKYASIDIETCGLNSKNDSILEFACVLEDTDKPEPLEKLPVFHCYFTPGPDGQYKGTPYALAMHSKIFAMLANPKLVDGTVLLAPRAFGKLVASFLALNGYEGRINVAGKNFGMFDSRFLSEQTDLFDHVKIGHRVIDPSILFWSDGDATLPDSATCMGRACEDQEPYVVPHTAEEDAKAVILMLRKGFSRLTSTNRI